MVVGVPFACTLESSRESFLYCYVNLGALRHKAVYTYMPKVYPTRCVLCQQELIFRFFICTRMCEVGNVQLS